MMLRLVPNIFYEKLSDGLDLFVTCLGFSVLYQDDQLAVVSRDGAKAYLVESTEFAAKDRPQIAIETDTIEDMFEEVSIRAPHILHPRSNQIELKPWGFRDSRCGTRPMFVSSSASLRSSHRRKWPFLNGFP
jgi:hypothetical protein